jgi:hypothetical protein
MILVERYAAHMLPGTYLGIFIYSLRAGLKAHREGCAKYGGKPVVFYYINDFFSVRLAESSFKTLTSINQKINVVFSSLVSERKVENWKF